MKGIEELKEQLQSPKKIVITTHQKPDGDALGSCLALYHYLAQKNHRVTVIAPTDYAFFLEWLPGNDLVLNFEKQNKQATSLINEAELIFCLDFNKLHRINDMGGLIENCEAETVLIDHHEDPDDFADYSFHHSSASSTAELIYDLIILMNDEHLLNKEVATCIYVGIMTDTGSFRFSSTTSKVHHIVAHLIDKGVDNSGAFERIYGSFSENRLRFIGYCINEKLQTLPEFKTAIIAVTHDELKKFSIKTGDTEGLVNFPLNIDDVMLSALIIDRSKLIKISLRSKGNFPCNDIVGKHFSGGGHINASGGESKKSLEETIADFIKVLPDYKEALHRCMDQG